MDKINEDELKNPLLIIVDLPALNRVDEVNPSKYKEIIKIDHHPYEEKMGDVEFYDVTASSAAQMIIELIFNTKLKLNKKIAENLFLGVVSDSERFLFPYTSVKTFELITKLLKTTNIDFTSLYKYLYERPINEIKFYGYMCQNLVVTGNGLGYIKITSEILREYNVDIATASNLVNSWTDIKEMIAWLTITFDEKTNNYRISIRSRGPIINEVAVKYNGGGHKMASGIKGLLEEQVQNVINDLDTVCKEYNQINKK